jgi:RNA polymerase sigma-70 factor (ECF subfamily)
MRELTDQELVDEVRKGRRSAFDELMRRHQERIYWAARRFVGNHDDAEDVAQETFVKAYLALGDYRGEARFFTWLYRIAFNLAVSAVRKRQVVSYLRQSELVRRVFPEPERPDSILELAETEERLLRAVAALPEKQRAVFTMHFFDELSYEEISEILTTSVGGLKANYHHAVRKVREYLQQ